MAKCRLGYNIDPCYACEGFEAEEKKSMDAKELFGLVGREYRSNVYGKRGKVIGVVDAEHVKVINGFGAEYVYSVSKVIGRLVDNIPAATQALVGQTYPSAIGGYTNTVIEAVDAVKVRVRLGYGGEAVKPVWYVLQRQAEDDEPKVKTFRVTTQVSNVVTGDTEAPSVRYVEAEDEYDIDVSIISVEKA